MRHPDRRSRAEVLRSEPVRQPGEEPRRRPGGIRPCHRAWTPLELLLDESAAAVILKVASMHDPPLRLLLGSDAVRFAEQADLTRIEADRKWRDLSISTDFAPDLDREGNGKD